MEDTGQKISLKIPTECNPIHSLTHMHKIVLIQSRIRTRGAHTGKEQCSEMVQSFSLGILAVWSSQIHRESTDGDKTHRFMPVDV